MSTSEKSLLSSLGELVKSLESSTSSVSSNELSMRITELSEELRSLRERVHSMPGVDVGPAEQQRRLELLREQLKRKKGLVAKFAKREVIKPNSNGSAASS